MEAKEEIKNMNWKHINRHAKSRIYGEGSGSNPVDEYFISNWINIFI